jgi:hypothetical protein
MKEVTIKFNIKDGYDELELFRTLKANDAYSTLIDIQQDIFRPARKHGYPNGDIRELLEKIDTALEGAGTQLVGLLEAEFFKILSRNDVNLEGV